MPQALQEMSNLWQITENKRKIVAQLVVMNALLMTSANPKLLADGVKLFPFVADNNESLEQHHGLEPHQLYTIEEIHVRAETVTPLLKEILDYQPVPHWEING